MKDGKERHGWFTVTQAVDIGTAGAKQEQTFQREHWETARAMSFTGGMEPNKIVGEFIIESAPYSPSWKAPCNVIALF